MVKETKEKLIEWAEIYNNKEFILSDPIQFPHRYIDKKDIEISGFITAWISYGRRPLILKKAEELHALFGNSPYDWIMRDEKERIRSCEILRKKNESKRDTCYRFYTFSDFFALTNRLHEIYRTYPSLEDAVASMEGENSIKKLQQLFNAITGIPNADTVSACKRLAMFLRWMVRNDKIVDLGIWSTYFTPKDLIIPLDTHVFRISKELGLISQRTPSMIAAIELTEVMKEIFPDDPCLADFSLFGYGVNSFSTYVEKL
ncbi:TIGR02757 family protein [Massilibacteroides sp.]|uniref:TIGR02757 family protein n=1 Tax=Massilibacteroides sp. TaxID=2034766 RepID=UPI0026115B77|nr:TIGR02757 family protein [Massilibacteroides sp.]MDD4515861.1 TIGR02757 family protein [Massilibacteroides sp.]